MTYREAIEAARRKYVSEVLAEARGDMRKAAEMAGVDRTHFYKLIHKYGPRRESARKRGNWFGLEA